MLSNGATVYDVANFPPSKSWSYAAEVENNLKFHLHMDYLVLF